MCDRKTDWLWVRSPLEEIKYLFTYIFSFLRSGVKAKRGVEVRHSTLNTRFPLPTLLCAEYSVKLIFNFDFKKISERFGRRL